MREHTGHRKEQLESTLKRAVQSVLAQGLSDPRADGAMLTVTDLKLGVDLKIATIRVSVYPEERQKLAMHALKHATPHIRHEASDLVALKQMPQLSFVLDVDTRKQAAVLGALSKVAAERDARAGDPPTVNNPPENPAT